GGALGWSSEGWSSEGWSSEGGGSGAHCSSAICNRALIRPATPPAVHPHPLLRAPPGLRLDGGGPQRPGGGGGGRAGERPEGGRGGAAVRLGLDEEGDGGELLPQGDLRRAHRGERRAAEEGHEDALHLGVLVDQHAEGATAAQRPQQLAGGAAAAARDGARAV